MSRLFSAARALSVTVPAAVAAGRSRPARRPPRGSGPGVTRASSPSGTRTLNGRPAARSAGRHSSATAVKPSRRSCGSAPAARAARAACSSSSSTSGEPLGLLQRGEGLPPRVRVGVGGQLVEAQLQRGQPAAQLVRHVADERPLALHQLGERGRRGVQHVGDPVQLGDAVPVRGASGSRRRPSRAARSATSRSGSASRRAVTVATTAPVPTDSTTSSSTTSVTCSCSVRMIDTRLVEGDRPAGPERQRLGDGVRAEVGPDDQRAAGRPAPRPAARPGARRARARRGRPAVDRAGAVQPGGHLLAAGESGRRG